MEEQDRDSSPFWFEPPATYRRRSPSPIVNPVILIILLPILALLVLFFLLPPLLSHTSNILRPNSVKKSWDSLNVILVLFAIICGVFARRNDDASSSSSSPTVNDATANVSIGDRKMFHSPARQPVTVGTSLRRSSSSYPDLRQESLWETGDNRFRFYDDFEVNLYRTPAPVPEPYNLRRSEEKSDVKEIPVDTFVNREKKTAVDLKRRRSFRAISKQEKFEKRSKSESEFQSPPPQPPPPPPPQKVHKQRRAQHDVQSTPVPPPPPPLPEKLQRKKSNTTKEIATAITSLYKRKRKPKMTNIYNQASDSQSHEYQTSIYSTPPPPPPPPPPPSVFHNMFKKTTKSKKIHSISSSTPPPPPPPPPPSSIFNNLFKSGTKSKRFHSTTATSTPPPPPPPPIVNNFFETGTKSKRFQSSPPSPVFTRLVNSRKPPLPTKVRDYNNGEESVIPVPPPLPPFKLPEMKFVRRGDYVKVASNQSSRAASPEPEDNDRKPVGETGIGESVGPSIGPGFCPSPDVNAKADTFIARLRGEWKLEKMNSVREKQKLGQSPISASNWGQM